MESTVESISGKKNDPLTGMKLAFEERREESARIRLLFELQSTLNIEQLLAIFFRHLKESVPCQHLVYLHEELDITVEQGSSARHRAEYQLTVASENLGKIRFHRRRPFSEEELERIETLLGTLILPIRNAIHYQQALRAASRDPLTGLKNRRSFEDNLEREISRARRENQSLGLMVVDVDWFKRINDEIGHLAGDRVLTEVAGALRKSVRRSDMVFRFAGDEFVLLLPNINERGVRILKNRLQNAISQLDCTHGGRTLPVSVSIGAAILDKGMNGRQLFEAADLDMLCNKEKHHHEQDLMTQQVG